MKSTPVPRTDKHGEVAAGVLHDAHERHAELLDHDPVDLPHLLDQSQGTSSAVPAAETSRSPAIRSGSSTGSASGQIALGTSGGDGAAMAKR
jgi:hypothetical protein